ncbi:hypothetical protein TNCV_1629071 [Trichonephila clavipes]|uniref:RNase H type-1 domain-containing protein n=1 Tax=Trichonephila clavipes TaxID=2585209 RepID=A0A8X7BH37_TRICX|nr:hypothetical protein TNCV_1629071 [Trichonephila clavipes]
MQVSNVVWSSMLVVLVVLILGRSVLAGDDAGVAVQWYPKCAPLETDLVISYAKIAAIRTALSQLQCHLEKFTRAVILSNSRADLLVVVSESNPKTQDVLGCHHDLKNLSSLEKNIVLQRIHAHCGIQSNQKADFLAKKGDLVMQKVYSPLSFHSIKNLIKRSIKARALDGLRGMLS